MLFEDPSYSSADSLCEPNPFLDASARLRKKNNEKYFGQVCRHTQSAQFI